jgi:hypothetical protein
VDIEAVLDQIIGAGVSVWLDAEGKLRIDKEAPPELKQLVREHKQELIDVKKAMALMNTTGIRIIRLPLGHLALAYRPGTDLNQIRWAMKVLRMDSMPLLINDEGLRWMTWREWKFSRRPSSGSEREHDVHHREPQRSAKLQFGRKTA